MQAQTIIQTFDVLKDGSPGFGSGVKRLGGAFNFQSADETLHNSIVISVAYPAHVNLAGVVDQFKLVICIGVLAALIGVRQQSSARAAGKPVSQLVKHTYRISSNFRYPQF